MVPYTSRPTPSRGPYPEPATTLGLGRADTANLRVTSLESAVPWSGLLGRDGDTWRSRVLERGHNMVYHSMVSDSKA